MTGNDQKVVILLSYVERCFYQFSQFYLAKNSLAVCDYILCISVEDEPPTKIARLTPFTGSGRRLDGKPSAPSVEQTSSPELKQRQTDKEIKGSDSKSSNTVSRRHSGKLVFGSNATTSDIQTTPKVVLSSGNLLERQRKALNL